MTRTTASRPHSSAGVILIIPSTSYRTAAFMEAAIKLDLKVMVITERTQVFEEVYPDSIITLDFKNWTDHLPQIRAWTGDLELKTVVGVDEESVLIAAEISSSLGIRHNSVDSVRKTRDKYLMRSCLEEAGLQSPWFHRFPIHGKASEMVEALSFPCVLKPTFLSASRGVVRVDGKEEFFTGLNMLRSLLGRPEMEELGGEQVHWFLAESYIPGREYSLEGIVMNGQLKPLALFDKPDPLEGPTFPETLYITPSRLDQKRQVELYEIAEKALKALGISQGPVHIEARLGNNGFHILECAARSIGGLCSRVLEFTGGMSLEELILRSSLGRDVESAHRLPDARGVMMMPVQCSGILRKIKGRDESLGVEGITGIEMTASPGDMLETLPWDGKYPGFLFAEGKDQVAVEGILRQAWSRMELVIEGV